MQRKMKHAVIDPHFIVIGSERDAVLHEFGAIPHAVISVAICGHNRISLHFDRAVVGQIGAISRPRCRVQRQPESAVPEKRKPAEHSVTFQARALEPLPACNRRLLV